MTSGDLFIVNGEGSGVKKRDKWQHQLDFVFSLIGYCVGLGNLRRFGGSRTSATEMEDVNFSSFSFTISALKKKTEM